MRLQRQSWTVAVSLPTAINLNGPFHFFVVVQKTSTGDPDGRSLSLFERFFSFDPPGCYSANVTLRRDFSDATAIVALSLAFSRSRASEKGACRRDGAALQIRGAIDVIPLDSLYRWRQRFLFAIIRVSDVGLQKGVSKLVVATSEWSAVSLNDANWSWSLNQGLLEGHSSCCKSLCHLLCYVR